IADALEDGIPLLMSVVNVGEVWYTLARRRSTRDADEAVRELQAIGIRFVEADWERARIAASFMSVPRAVATGFPNWADCFAAAPAQQFGGKLIICDP